MAEIIDITLEKRNTIFEPTVIWALIICETDFDFFKDPVLCRKLAEDQHNYLRELQELDLKIGFLNKNKSQEVKDLALKQL